MRIPFSISENAPTRTLYKPSSYTIKTGKPADSGLISVSIISSDGTLSDGLSTSLFIMGKQKGIKYWQKNKDKFDVVWLENDGTVTITDGIEDVFSSDFKYSVVG